MGFILHDFDNPIKILRLLKKEWLIQDGVVIVYEFVFSSIPIYMKHWAHRTEDENLKMYPKPAKYSHNDILYIFNQANFQVVEATKTIPVADVFIGK